MHFTSRNAFVTWANFEARKNNTTKCKSLILTAAVADVGAIGDVILTPFPLSCHRQIFLLYFRHTRSMLSPPL